MSRPNCPKCGQFDFVVDWRLGETVCTGCALVVESRMLMDQLPPEPLHGTEKWDFEAEGTRISMCASRTRTSDGSTRMMHNLHNGLHGGSRIHAPHLDDVCKFKLRLPGCIIECAREMVAKVSNVEQQSSRGKSLIGIQACSVYHACIMQQQAGVPRSIQEIVRAFDITEPVFTKANHRLQAALEGTIYSRHLFETNKSSDLVTRSLDRLSILTSAAMKQCVRKLSLKILNDFETKNLLQERTTPSVAAVAIFLALRESGLKMTMSKYTAEIDLTGQATLSIILKQLEKDGWALTCN